MLGRSRWSRRDATFIKNSAPPPPQHTHTCMRGRTHTYPHVLRPRHKCTGDAMESISLQQMFRVRGMYDQQLPVHKQNGVGLTTHTYIRSSSQLNRQDASHN